MNSQISATTTPGMIHGSRVMVRTRARPRKDWCSRSAAAKPPRNWKLTEPNTHRNEFHKLSQNVSSWSRRA